ncbi:MAG: hypothetical protein PHN19_03365 [Patescibacteria group bacterium]|nr:hypothetical protein [Patescibacteria group bacterium]
MVRDNNWLKQRLIFFLQNYFSDIQIKNDIVILFGRKAKARLGSIKLNPENNQTIITLTSYFKDEKIPQYVVDATIIHELVHYAHGFSSPLAQSFRHPHQGGIIRKEMSSRGLDDYFLKSKIWLKKNWPGIIGLNIRIRRRIIRKKRINIFNFFRFLNI